VFECFEFVLSNRHVKAKKIKRFGGEWSNKIKNLDKAHNLESISFYRYKPKSKNLLELSELSNLIELN
jgi:hypothetical protein